MVLVGPIIKGGKGVYHQQSVQRIWHRQELRLVEGGNRKEPTADRDKQDPGRQQPGEQRVSLEPLDSLGLAVRERERISNSFQRIFFLFVEFFKKKFVQKVDKCSLEDWV